jgi:F0F1-type ATP synthase assembly protein I
MKEEEKAEYIQSYKAYFIPSGLFVSCLITSAGMFLVYSHVTAGWIFIVIGLTLMALAFIAFIRFHNKLRAAGRYAKAEDQEKQEN